MPRALLMRVIAGLLCPLSEQDQAAADKKDAEKAADAPEQQKPRPPQVMHFFDVQMKYAMCHCEERRHRLQLKIAAKANAHLQAEISLPKLPQSESTPDKVVMWPPLPPRSIQEKDLPIWQSGVRQWEEEMHKQNAPRLHAMLSSTEAVLQGEVLGAQLLEPEVLHFATRFRPLFERLFKAYADDRMPSTNKDDKEEEARQGSK